MHIVNGPVTGPIATVFNFCDFTVMKITSTWKTISYLTDLSHHRLIYLCTLFYDRPFPFGRILTAKILRALDSAESAPIACSSS